MIKVLTLLYKKDGLGRRAFIEYYEHNHVPLILSLAPAPPVYKRSYPVREDASVEDFDVVTELQFPDRAAYDTWLAAILTGAAGEQVVADEARFLDRSRTRSQLVEEYVTA
jgi:hypothetical protein